MSDVKCLRDMVSAVLERRWEEWAKEHQHLAAAIDRVRLVETVVADVKSDPRVQEAMAGAERNGEALRLVSGMADVVESVVRRVVGL